MTSYGASQLIIAQVLLKKIENPDFDAGGTLTHQAQAKNFFKFFEIHIIHREFQYEQNAVSVRRLRKIFPEKNVSKKEKCGFHRRLDLEGFSQALEKSFNMVTNFHGQIRILH